jgi:site-specific DNA-methyltransferase (adenine-specific)
VTAPYYADDLVTLYHGDCREVTEWLEADVLVTDPPYGIGWSRGERAATHNPAGHEGIAGDKDTSLRDDALTTWGIIRPAVVFGSLRAPYPDGWKRMLVFRKPLVGCGLYGNRMPWLANWEPVFALGEWPDQVPRLDSVISTRAPSGSGYSGYATRYGHPHAKPVDVMEALIAACPPGVIADPFFGSGSTLVAARNLGRRAIGVEIDERYCERAARRLSQGVLTP